MLLDGAFLKRGLILRQNEFQNDRRLNVFKQEFIVNKKFTEKDLIRVAVIVFVVSVYLFMVLKILVLK